MTGQAHWITLALLGIVAAGIAALFLFKLRLEHRFRTILRRKQCPKTGKEVVTTMVRDAQTGEWTGVESCSAFAVPTRITCERGCVNASNNEEARALGKSLATALGASEKRI